ncbi:MAG: hypothetical protein DWQ34_09990 [Planctomycetota bacterium]|nr:MAG: hypothetical protein DWQ34_09990 [Planctomycetota bacterium]REK20325.1 MAG: hypothetical protein DWQ41_25370 [Planctomycetota bacterium]REK26822.1 MAG: hypothetical protein DWQ45_26670 [Planctomycetota bacterium]
MNDPKQLRKETQWTSQDVLFGIARLPETSTLFIGSSDFGVYAFDAAAESPERVAFSGDGHSSYVTGVARAGGQLVSGSYDGRLIWWDVESRTQVRSLDAHDRWIRRVIATPDGGRIVSIADDMQIKVWDAGDGKPVAEFSDHDPLTPHDYPSMLYAVAVSADGRWLASGDKTGHVVVWNAETFEKVAEVETPVMYTWDPKQRRHSIGGVRSLAFSPDGTRLAVGGIGTIGNIDHLGGPSRVEIFQWESGERLFELENEERKGLVEQIVWSPDGSWILCGGGDHKGFLKFYDMTTGDLIHQDGGDGHVHGFVLDEDWTTIFTACHQRIERWTIEAAASAEGSDAAAEMTGDTESN